MPDTAVDYNGDGEEDLPGVSQDELEPFDDSEHSDHDAESLDGLPNKRKSKRMISQQEDFELYTPDEEKAVRHKLDFRLVGFVAVLYMLSFLDRSNIGNAQLAGLSRDLELSDTQYTILLRSFYVTYILFEWMTLLYRVFPAHIYIAACVFSWGLVASAQALVTGFGGMLICRLLLGTTEAAFGPGVPYYLSSFYPRHELAYRVGMFISAAPLASCFASSLAYAITRWGEGTRLQGWRMLFLIEGFPSVLVAVWVWIYMPDSPGTARWLTPRERHIAESRLRQQGKEEDNSHGTGKRKHLDWAAIKATFKDPKSYLTAGMFFSCNIAFSSMPVFEPIVVNSMGYEEATAQGLSALPHAAAFVGVWVFSNLSDRSNTRSLFIIPVALLSMLGYLGLALAPKLGLPAVLRYLCLFPITIGFFTAVTLTIVWTMDNQVSSSSKGAGVVILNIFGQMAPLVGTGLYPARDKPNYVPGHATCAVFMGMVAILAASLRFYLAKKNRAQVDQDYEMVGLNGGQGAGLDDEDQTGPGFGKPKTRFEYML